MRTTHLVAMACGVGGLALAVACSSDATRAQSGDAGSDTSVPEGGTADAGSDTSVPEGGTADVGADAATLDDGAVNPPDADAASDGGVDAPSDGDACPPPLVLRYEAPGCGAEAHPVCGSALEDACAIVVCSCDGRWITKCDYAGEPWEPTGCSEAGYDAKSE
jgi:hypothetical protein